MGRNFDPYHKWLGIAPVEQPADYYRLLGIQRFEADPDVIHAAADQRMAHLRNYQTGQHADLSQRLLNEVATARVSLLNAGKKAAYDGQLRTKAAQEAAAAEEGRVGRLWHPVPAAVVRSPGRGVREHGNAPRAAVAESFGLPAAENAPAQPQHRHRGGGRLPGADRGLVLEGGGGIDPVGRGVGHAAGGQGWHSDRTDTWRSGRCQAGAAPRWDGCEEEPRTAPSAGRCAEPAAPAKFRCSVGAGTGVPRRQRRKRVPRPRWATRTRRRNRRPSEAPSNPIQPRSRGRSRRLRARTPPPNDRPQTKRRRRLPI